MNDQEKALQQINSLLQDKPGDLLTFYFLLFYLLLFLLFLLLFCLLYLLYELELNEFLFF